MSNQENLLIQKIECNKNELDLSFLRESTFIEVLDLSGPKLILKFDDKESILRDRMKVKELDELTVTIADPYARDGVNLIAKFVVLTMPVSGKEFVTLNCIQKEVNILKTPSIKAVLFSRKNVLTIFKRLLPDYRYDVDSSPIACDYHLLPGERASLLLRQISKENGAVIYISRGKLFFKKLTSLFEAKPKIQYHYNDIKQENQIIFYSKLNAESVLKDKIVRNYSGFSMTDGYIKSRVDEGCPPEMTSIPYKVILNNLSIFPIPVIDFTVLGNGALMPGIPLELIWNRYNIEMPIDESLPSKVVIST
ncbi:MAG: hypothetical protein HQK79_20725, partial [Desulfobacterales bacterium]|nr:hypothetical protein [Desulfobacterales bacterium]